MRRPRGSTLFAATLLVLVVSLLAYMTVSHAQSDQNGGAFNATAESMGDNGTLAENGSLNIQNGTALQTPPGIIPTDNGTQDQSVQNGTPDNQSISDNGTLSGNGTTGQSVQSSGYAVSGAGYGVMDNDPTLNCPNITLPGTYTMTTINYTGAPNSASPLTGASCVRINSSNVVFDCAGHSITNNSAGQTFGILVAGPVTNVTVQNCNVFNYNYGIYYYSSNNSNILDNVANNDNNTGIYLDSSNNATLSNNIANNNTFYGIFFNSSNNVVSNNSAGNNYDGIAFSSHSANMYNNTLSNNTASNNSNYGIVFDTSNNTALYNNIANNNGYAGIGIGTSSNSTISNNSVVNNGAWAFDSQFSAMGVVVENLTVGNNTVSFTSKDVSIQDSPHPPQSDPPGLSDINRFVEVASNSFDSFIFLNLSYTPADVVSLNENTLFMLEYNLSILNPVWITNPADFASPYGVDTSDKYVFANISTLPPPSTAYSIFGIFNASQVYSTLYTNCPTISKPGTYVMGMNFTGQPTYTPVGYAFQTCVRITSSNVTFDCAGHSIIGTAWPATGIIFAMTDNVTVKNCIISNYTNPIIEYNSTNSSILNNTIGLSYLYGIWVQSSNNNTLCNNNETNDPSLSNGHGIMVENSNNNVLCNDTASYNTQSGIVLDSSNNNTLYGNLAFRDYADDYGAYAAVCNGIWLVNSSQNTMYNNVFYYDAGAGIRVDPSSNNNTMYNNTAHSLELAFALSGSQNTAYNNTAYNGPIYFTPDGFDVGVLGFAVYAATQIAVYNNSVYNASYGGISLNSVNQSVFYDNNIYNVNSGAITLTASSNNALYNNSITNAFGAGIDLGEQTCNNNNLSFNSVSNTSVGLFGASDNTTVYNNTFNNNNAGGITMAGNNDVIYDNIIENSTSPYTFPYSCMTYGHGIYFGDGAYGTSLFNIASSNTSIYNNRLSNDYYGIEISGYDINVSNNVAGNGPNSGIYVNCMSNNVTVYNNSADNNRYYGIAVASSTNNTLFNNDAEGNGYCGIGMYEAPAYYPPPSGNTLSNNIADNNAALGISLVSADNNTVYNNSADNEGSIGILVTSNSTNNSIFNNSADNNYNYGIAISSSDNNTVSNISADNNGNDGFYILYSNNNTLSNSSANNNGQWGIYLQSSNNNTLSNSSANNNGQWGIYLQSSNNNTLSNSSANNNGQWGIYLQSSNNNTLSNSSANNNSEDGIIFGSSNNNILFNNIAESNWSGISLWYSNNNNLYNNIADNSSWGDGFNIEQSSWNNIYNNSANNNYGSGIYLVDGSNTDATDNNAIYSNNVDNSFFGIDLLDSNNNNIYDNSADNDSSEGIFLDMSNNNTLYNDSADNSSYLGIELYASNQTTMDNDSANNNRYFGIVLYASNQNVLSNNSAMENGYLDLYVDPFYPYASPDGCQNNITNTTGSAYRPIYYFSDPVSWDSLDAAEIELCGATGSNVTNSVVNGSDTLYNDGFLIYYNDNATINNTSSSYNYFGFDIGQSNNGTYLNDSADNNSNPGFLMWFSDSNSIIGSSASGNNQYAYEFDDVTSSNMTNDTATESIYGFYLGSSQNNVFSGCNASGNANWAFSSNSGSQGNVAENLTLGHDIVSFDSKDININDSAHPQGYSGGSPSVEVHIYSSDGSNEKVTGISDGPAGSNDITSFGPISNDYNGSVAYTQTPAGGAVAATIPTDITPVSDISSPQTMSGDDALSDDILLPFNVTLFGRQNDHIVISTNGFIYLSNETVASSDPSCCGQATMSSQGITQGSDYLVAGLWTDLVSDGVVSNITYGVAGTAPNRVYIISYDHNAEYDGSDTFGNNTFEIKLFENGTNSSATSAPDPTGLSDINRFVQSTANSPDSYLFLNFSYLLSDVASLNESTLFIGKYDSSGWDVIPSDFSSSSGLDTYSTYVFANITGFGSVFGILGGAAPSSPSTPAPIPPSPYVPSNEVPLSLSLTRAPCPANQVTVTAYSGPGTKIRLLLTSPYEGLVDQQTTGNDGTATFQLSASGTYEADGSQNGYLPGSATFTFTTCAIAPPPVPPPVPSSGCTSDDQCPLVDFCNLSIGACQPVTGVCGFAANHAWSSYQCCQDADCAPSNICIVHTCEPVDLTGDKEGLVGGQGKVHATVGGQAFVNATLQIILPDGASFQTTTDANGDALLPFSFHGNYTVNLLLAGSSVKTHIIAVALPPPAAQVPTPALVQQPTNYCWVLPLIIAMILAYLAYRKWRNGKNKKKQPLKP